MDNKLLQLIREYKPKNKNNLDFLITDVDKIITFLKKPEHHLDKQKALYSPIVKFIFYLPFDTTTTDEAHHDGISSTFKTRAGHEAIPGPDII